MEYPTKEQIGEIFTKCKGGYTRILKARHKNFYTFIDTNYIGKKFGEKLYRWINSEIPNIGKCINCGKDCKFDDIFYGFRKSCSLKCSNNDLSVQEKKKQTYFEKYGVKNPSQADEVKESKKQTFIKHFGIDCNLRLEETKKKIKETCLKKYNSEYFLQSDEYKKKTWSKFYETLISSERLKNEMVPMFSLDDYKGVEEKYNFKCLKCNNIFKDHLQDGRIPRCYNCYPRKMVSYGEIEIMEFIKYLDDKLIIESSNRSLPSGKELDIYLPSLKIAIEFDGLFWHSENGGKKDKNYHLNKTEECEKLGIRLIHIFEDEWMNKQEIVKNRLKHALGYDKLDKIYARKCSIKEILFSKCSDFLKEHHLQGEDNSSVRLGLYYQNKLVSVMTFGKLRKALGSKNTNEKEYEMYRFCSSQNVIGAGGKLLSQFIKTHNPSKIISYADRRWSNDTSFYSKIGFSKILKTQPNYFYTNDYLTKYHRFNFRKDQLSKKLQSFDPSLSEWENMQLNGYDRIWDCGHLKYELINK